MQIDPASLDWRRAYSWPLLSGVVKQHPADFEVNEILGFRPDGGGEHDLLWLCKVGSNTQWVADQLARYAGVKAHDVGFCGRKDRHAVTRQWFSVRRPSGSGTDWQNCQIEGVSFIEQYRHRKKLRPGMHKANRFAINVNAINVADPASIDDGLTTISRQGVPNYFGKQRFGHNGENLSLAGAAIGGRRLRKSKLGLAISAARAFVFNEIVASRIGRKHWRTALPGEALNLDGNNSIFICDEVDAEIQSRLAAQDIHPTAALWGRGNAQCTGPARQFEEDAVADVRQWCDGLENIGASAARRATRLRVDDLSWQWREDSLRIEFVLRSGGFATTVLREIVSPQ